jgi:mono/diheme cytochrome c family protein
MIIIKKKLKTHTLSVCLIIILLTSLTLSTPACKGKGKSTDKESVEQTDFSAGEKVYISKCTLCHQADGKGIPGAFPGLTGKKAELKTVYNGREGSIMKAFKYELPDNQIIDVVNYVNHSWGNNFPVLSVDSLKVLK